MVSDHRAVMEMVELLTENFNPDDMAALAYGILEAQRVQLVAYDRAVLDENLYEMLEWDDDLDEDMSQEDRDKIVDHAFQSSDWTSLLYDLPDDLYDHVREVTQQILRDSASALGLTVEEDED